MHRLQRYNDIFCSNIWYLVLIILLLNSLAANSQQNQYRFVNFTEEDEYCYNTINSFEQDSYGFIWFATEKNLVRYDGYSFKEFEFPSYPRIIFKDRIQNEEAIVLTIDKRIYFFNLNKYTLNPITDDKGNILEASFVLKDNNGRYLIVNKSNIIYYNPQDFKIENQFSKISKGYTVVDPFNNSIWQNNNDTIYNYFLESEEVKTYKVNYPASPLFNTTFNTIGFFDVHLSLWIYDKSNDVFKQYKKSSLSKNHKVISIEIDKFNNYWLLTQNGLFVYNVVDDSYKHIKYEGYQPDNLLTNNIKTIFIDNNSILWVGTEKNGFSKCNIASSKLTIIQSGNKASDLTDNHIYSLEKDETGNILIGTHNGLNRYNTSINTNQYIPYFNSINPGFVVKQITSIASENENTIWVGSISHGLFKIDLPGENETQGITGNIKDLCNITGFFPNSKSADPHISGWSVRDILIDDEENIWVAVSNAINKIQDNKFEYFFNDSISKAKYLTGPMVDLCQGFKVYSEFIFAAAKTKILYINKSDNSIGCLQSKESFKEIRQICNDNSGYLWILTTNSLFKARIDTTAMSLEVVSKLQLEENNCFRFDIDTIDGRIWIGTKKGLFQTNNNLNGFNSIDRDFGLPSSIITDVKYDYATKELFLGTAKGAVFFTPNKNTLNPDTSSIRFTRLFIYGREINPGDTINGRVLISENINNTQSLTLKYADHDIRLEFSSGSYKSTRNIVYRYILEGYDQDWRSTTPPSHEVIYSNLPAGKFILKVKNDNQKDAGVAQIELIVKAPWWNTWLFKIVIILLIVAGFILFVNIRTRSIKKHKNLLEQQVKLRTKQLVEQKEELLVKSESLMEANHQLSESKEEILLQAEELSDLNQELSQINASKDKLFSIIAHDLKNPFHGIIGLTELLQNRYNTLDDEKKKEFIGMINGAAVSSANLLENLLTWAGTQTRKVIFKPDIIDLESVVKNTLQLLSLNANKKLITLKSSVPSDFFVYADKNMITTIVRNIINNAIKFTPEGGSIHISSTISEESGDILIKDSGVGMNSEQIKNLFRIDKQSSSSGTSGEKGTGLGLLICDEFIKRNNGAIVVESKPGEGTTFIIKIPLQPDVIIKQSKNEDLNTEISEVPASNENSIVSESEEMENTFDKNSIIAGLPLLLCVEDSNELRMNLLHSFKDIYNVLISKNGEEGYALALETIPDIIVSDVMMPVMNGYELCRKLKNDIRTSHIPIILLTAKTNEQSQLEGYESGADDYLTKPYSISILKSKIANILNAREVLRVKYSQSLRSEDMFEITDKTFDKGFLEKINQYIESHISESELDGDKLAGHLLMSKSNLYKKIQSLTNQTVNEYIRSYRLKKSILLLKAGKKNIAEIAYDMGFSSPTYFSKCFKDQFGISPRQYYSLK